MAQGDRADADAAGRRRDELAPTLTLDQGKPLEAEAYPEVDDLIGHCRGNVGSDRQPDRSYNAPANPDVTVEAGT